MVRHETQKQIQWRHIEWCWLKNGIWYFCGSERRSFSLPQKTSCLIGCQCFCQGQRHK